MSIGSSIAIQLSDDEKYKFAYYSSIYKKTMILNENQLTDAISGTNVICVYPKGETTDNLLFRAKTIEERGGRIQRKISVSEAVITFYKIQNIIIQDKDNLFVVDVQNNFTDISAVMRFSDNRDKSENYRIEYGEKSVEIGDLESLVTHIVKRIKKYQYFNKSVSGKVFLSGEVFANQLLVEQLRKMLSGYQLYAYKPADAAVLGAAYHAQGYFSDKEIYIGNQETKCQRNVNNFYKLELKQRKAYEILLDAVIHKKSEAVFCGNEHDICHVYHALILDYPEVELIWDYGQSSYTKNVIAGQSCTIKMFLKYKKNSEALLRQIDNKAEQIIQKCIGRGSVSDEELVKAVYKNLSEEYIYSKEKNSDGSYPDYAYTLEALLKNGVCRGYAMSMVYILKKLQIPVMYIDGKADGQEFGGHAWNLVQNVEGKIRHLDVTWDLGKPENQFNHFNLDDIQMRARRHFWDVREFPKCS